MKYLLLFFIPILLFSCSLPQQKETKQTIQDGQVSFDVNGSSMKATPVTEKNMLGVTTESKEFLGTAKATFDMRIDREASKEEIQAVAETLQEKNPNYERYFISYYLLNQKIDTEAWATSHIENGKIDIHFSDETVMKEKTVEEMSDLERGQYVESHPNTKWALFELIPSTKWNKEKIVNKLGNYEMVEITSGNPNVIKAYYFPEAKVTIFRNIYKDEIQVVRLGRATE